MVNGNVFLSLAGSAMYVPAAIFAMVFFGLQWLYQFSRGTGFERLVIDEVTVKPASLILNSLWDVNVAAQGHRLVSAQTTLNVLNGCEGVESLLLFWAAVVAFRCQFHCKLVAMLLGTVFIFLINQLRIISLFFAAGYDKALFSALHGFIAPILIIMLIGLFYLGWVRWAQARR